MKKRISMKPIIGLLFLLMYVMLFTSCKKEEFPKPEDPKIPIIYGDKQIRFDLGIAISAGDTTLATLDNSPNGIHQFNIGDYVGVDSAIFVIYNIATAEGCCGGPDIIMDARFELYDLTNNQPIVNSEVISDDIPLGTFAVSRNFANNLPKQTIDIGVRIITERDIYTTTGKIYMFLYRK